MPVSLTSVCAWKWCLPKSFVSAIFTNIRLHDILFWFSPLTDPTMHQPSLAWNAYGPLSQQGIVLSGSKDFVQLAPISKLTEISSLLLILFMMPSKYFDCFSFYGVAMSSWSTGRHLFVNFFGNLNPFTIFISATWYLQSFNQCCFIVNFTINCLYNNGCLLSIYHKIF